MPYMQCLTWQGVALRAGQLSGYPASHGCIRLPKGFARLLYDSTKVGMTVVVTDQAASPRIAAAPDITRSSAAASDAAEAIEWHPEKSPKGPVSIIASSSDRKALVLRNGVVIASGPVTVDGAVQGSWMYALRNVDSSGQHWIRMRLSGADAGLPVAREEWQRFRPPEELRRKIGAILEPGTTIVVTGDSLAPPRDEPWLGPDGERARGTSRHSLNCSRELGSRRRGRRYSFAAMPIRSRSNSSTGTGWLCSGRAGWPRSSCATGLWTRGIPGMLLFAFTGRLLETDLLIRVHSPVAARSAIRTLTY